VRQSLVQRAYTEIEHGNKGKRLAAILLNAPATKYKFKVRRNTLKDRHLAAMLCEQAVDALSGARAARTRFEARPKNVDHMHGWNGHSLRVKYLTVLYMHHSHSLQEYFNLVWFVDNLF